MLGRWPVAVTSQQSDPPDTGGSTIAEVDSDTGRLISARQPDGWIVRYGDRLQFKALMLDRAAAERQAEQTYTDNARTAADAYAQNLRAARVAADRTRDSHDRLRDAIAATAPGSCAGAPAAAASAADGTAELRKVLGSCAAALRDLAEAADQDAAQLVGLQQHLRAIGIAPPASAPSD